MHAQPSSATPWKRSNLQAREVGADLLRFFLLTLRRQNQLGPLEPVCSLPWGWGEVSSEGHGN